MKKIAALGFALLMIFAVFVPVVSAINDPTKEGYQNAYNPNPAGEKSPENVGHLDVLLACRAPQIGGEFSIVPVTVSAPFTNGARVDKGFVDQFVKQFGEPKVEQYLPDGTFDSNYAPGTYLLKQIDGNGGQPEFALVTIKAACAETVVFLGHGITPASEPKEDELTPITILTATYGMTKLVYVPCVPAVTHQETVVDQAAYDETVVDVPAVAPHYEHAFDTQTTQVPCTHIVPAVPAVTHTVTVVDVPAIPAQPAVYRQGTPCSKYTFGHVHANQVGGTADNQNRFVYNGHVYEINNGNGGDTFTVTGTYIPGTPAVPAVTHTETVVDVPAVPAHPEHAFDTQTTQVPCTHYDEGTPAVTHVVHHAAVTHTVTVVDTPAVPASFHLEGSFKSVKTQVQAAVDAGERTLKFDNAQNPGGLFDDENNLLAAITDPAPGQVKKFVITYKINGHIKVKAGNEYEVFTLE